MEDPTAGPANDPVERMSRRAREISHDINNCLGVMTGRAELALMHVERGDAEKARAGLQTVLEQTEKMNALVASLRNLKEEAGAGTGG